MATRRLPPLRALEAFVRTVRLGSARAAALRAEVAETMTKSDLAKALRDARQWMTQH